MSYTGYNGWKNKETWLVNLWLGDYFAELQEEGTTIDADFVMLTVEEMCESNTTGSGFMIDLLNCALGEIDYREIAQFYATEES